MTVVDTVLQVHATLARARIPHGFGGAIALEYVVEPRGTVDVDVNVFVEPDRIDRVLTPLAGVGYAPERDDWEPVSGIRIRRSGDVVPVDLFPSVDPSYVQILDVDQIERLLVSLRGTTMYPRIARLRAMLAGRV